MKTAFYFAIASALTLTACNDFLTRDPLDEIADNPEFWDVESNIRTAVYDEYTTYFPGYRNHWNRADWFSQTNIADWTDDNAQQKATFFTKVAPASTSASSWDFSDVRVINVLINRINSANLSSEAKEHWTGVARFLRAMEYAKLVSRFGNVPYYEEALGNTDYTALYRQRENRVTVMNKVLDDLNYAIQHIRTSDGEKGLNITRDVALAYASRLMLFEGTWQKYRENNTANAKHFLQAAKDFATTLMSENHYSLCANYKDLTTSEDLAGNPEVILYRSYVEGVVMHSLMTFQNTEVEIDSPSKSLVESYLTKNGLPIHQVGNTQYQGDHTFAAEVTDRDPRLAATIRTSGLSLTGIDDVWAISGYFGNRFVNPNLIDKPGGSSYTCITDAPVMKLNEVLMNYIEAAAELADMGAYTLTQADFDKTINVIRDRPSTQMPHLILAGSNLQVNGVTINDPERDADVTPIIWEIRRERRTELVYEGIRFNDLRRWSKLHYADMVRNPKANRGAYLDKTAFVAQYNATHTTPITVETLKGVKIEGGGTAGYIQPITNTALMRTMAEKDYLYPLPQDQITLYKSRGYELPQNPGW
ncbi:RagB/SusD family nutrient uptake outer membrane protein [Segatella oulorum]|uniref:RagB/SusD family nutrient uptake outer membrane protein n=1 Tax=Segatella oulorum TaxID=28136 RepID=UPI0023F24412|nr:RagB/SusD family nutrient uptake outer membrane protein [Segatella oulorum]